MPPDNRTRAAVTKPITPALSSNFRARPAVAPRLAGSAPSSPANGPQRVLKAHTLSPGREEENVSSLNGNITPRSGARNSRIGTDSPATPLGPRSNQSGAVKDSSPQLGLGISSPQQRPPPGTGHISAPVVPRRVSGGSNVSQAKEDTKFFLANDARHVATPPQRRPDLRSPPVASVRTASPRQSPKKLTQDASPEFENKFFRANDYAGQNDPKQTRPVLSTKFSSSSSLSSKTHSVSTPKHERTPQTAQKLPQAVNRDPVSPTKSRTRTTSLASSPSSPVARRRSSSVNVLNNSPTRDHFKSASTSIVNVASNILRNPPSSNIHQTSAIYNPQIVVEPGSTPGAAAASISPDTISPRSTSINSSNTVTTSMTSDTEHSELSKTGQIFPTFKHVRANSEVQQAISPISQGQLEAAANARRERKVLDLEISNSSLLAINKTLERELRKQNTELRRFRRLSRSGRLSLAPTTRSVSGPSVASLDTLDELEDEDDNESEIESEEDTLDDDILSEEGSSAMSSTDRARRRARDEKRLMLDLSKHQQMLIDSQKLSQSIQRCLNCTDELIKDGTKALAYHVGVGDIKLGGRVLSHDEDEERHSTNEEQNISDQPESRQGLLSPPTTLTSLEEASMWLGAFQRSAEQASIALNDSKMLPLPTTESPSPMASPQLPPDR